MCNLTAKEDFFEVVSKGARKSEYVESHWYLESC